MPEHAKSDQSKAAPSPAAHASPTPGPWIVETDVFGKLDISVFARVVRYDTRIAMIEGRESRDDTSPPREVALANAHLIAAAPDLYEALLALSLLSYQPNDARVWHRTLGDIRQQVIAALAKAEGTEP